ncbi:MAG: SpoIIE family protein phosphatase [Prevotella sp.]|nr:SpoIIE family protein phosphatase [Prevotella sp.]
MKSPLQYIKQSLSMRLSLWIVLFAAAVFLAALGFMFVESRRAVRLEAENRASEVLESTVQRVNGILDHVVVATDNVAWLVMRHLDAPDSMFIYSRCILENNPYLNGCSIAFEPDFFKSRGRYFSAYSYNDHGTILTTQEGNEQYEYFYMDWYQLVKLLDRPSWTEPFFDYNLNDIYSKDMIASYCKPLKDPNGRYVGTIAVDISLEWLSNTISAVKPYPNSYSIMIGEGGTYFVHPDSTKLFYQSIFTSSLLKPDPELISLGNAMQRGEEGMKQIRLEDEDCYVFYKPLSTTGWSMAIVCPESDIYSGYNRLQRTVTIIVLVGLLLMLLVFSRIVGWELKPLKRLARQTEFIASGNFDVELTAGSRIDEIGQLTKSFDNMQHSLVNYIEELKRTTALKASIESELKVASDIQMSMVPRIFPAFPNREDIDIYASMTPAKEVGGDLYDFFVQDDKLYFCLGDVSGKGVPASLFMAVTRNLFRIVAQQGKSPVEVAEQTNVFLAKDNEPGMLVTMFIGMADLKTGRLDFCNCGHNPPFIDGKFIEIEHENQALGLWEEAPFYGETIDNIKGKQLLLYTDGLNEAENSEHELLGENRLLELMASAAKLSSKEVVEMLRKLVEEHRAGADPNDDLTLMCLRIL